VRAEAERGGRGGSEEADAKGKRQGERREKGKRGRKERDEDRQNDVTPPSVHTKAGLFAAFHM